MRGSTSLREGYGKECEISLCERICELYAPVMRVSELCQGLGGCGDGILDLVA